MFSSQSEERERNRVYSSTAFGIVKFRGARIDQILHFEDRASLYNDLQIKPTRCTYFLKKAKAVPLQAWSGPEGSRKLRFPDFMTTAQGGGKVVSLTHRPPLPPGNAPGTHFC